MIKKKIFETLNKYASNEKFQDFLFQDKRFDSEKIEKSTNCNESNRRAKEKGSEMFFCLKV